MKILTLVSTFLFSLNVFACACSGAGPMNYVPLAMDLIRSNYGQDVTFIPQGKYEIFFVPYKTYPSVIEKLERRYGGLENSSCHYAGPNGEVHHYCAPTLKEDVVANIVLANGKSCEVRLRARSLAWKAKVKILWSNC